VDFYSAIRYLLFVVIVTILVKPLGGYMERVFSRQRTLLDYAFLLSGLSIE
jgi:K+-transporting ATPase A subunit